MSIFVGSNNIDNIRIGDGAGGDTNIQSVYIGATRKWVKPLMYNITVGTSGAYPDGSAQWGFNSSGVIGSFSIVDQTYILDWLKDQGGVSQAAGGFSRLSWQGGGSGTESLTLTLGSTGTPASPVPNTNATFSTLTIDGTVYSRANADSYVYNTGSNFSSWIWNTSTNSFGTTTGAVKRARFDKP